jgi:hypothetical protein
MRPPPLLIALSLAANAALLAALILRPSLASPAWRDFFARSPSTEEIAAKKRIHDAETAKAAADRLVRGAAAESQLWSAIASDDTRTLIARLKAAGFPPSVVRLMVDVQLTAKARARFFAEVGDKASSPYWRADLTSYMAISSNAKLWDIYGEIYRERSKQFREALNDDFFANVGEITAGQRRNYGDISKSKIAQIERIAADYDDISAQVQKSLQGVVLAEDREKFDLLQRERRADIARVLTAEEFADYEMRTSEFLQSRRAAFSTMNATEEEARSLYRLQRPLEERVRAAETDDSPAGEALREGRSPEHEQLMRDIRALLGEQRYAEYVRASDPAFQSLNRITQREGLPMETTFQAYALRDRIATESNRILNDATQTNDQKQASLKVLAQNTRAQLLSTLGSTSGPAYVQLANRWLSAVEGGQAVSFDPKNGTTTFKKLPGGTP